MEALRAQLIGPPGDRDRAMVAKLRLVGAEPIQTVRIVPPQKLVIFKSQPLHCYSCLVRMSCILFRSAASSLPVLVLHPACYAYGFGNMYAKIAGKSDAPELLPTGSSCSSEHAGQGCDAQPGCGCPILLLNHPRPVGPGILASLLNKQLKCSNFCEGAMVGGLNRAARRPPCTVD